jgi:hypothetical protein
VIEAPCSYGITEEVIWSHEYRLVSPQGESLVGEFVNRLQATWKELVKKIKEMYYYHGRKH